MLLIPSLLANLASPEWAAGEPATQPPLPATPPEVPINRQSTADAWAAFRAGDYATAIAKADVCIERFQKPAETIQTILEKKKAMLPTGAASAAERQRIDRYQILHDVATCLLIKAWAREKEGRKREAVTAYAQARRYSYARAAERDGEPYWSPAEVAGQHLGRLVP